MKKVFDSADYFMEAAKTQEKHPEPESIQENDDKIEKISRKAPATREPKKKFTFDSAEYFLNKYNVRTIQSLTNVH